MTKREQIFVRLAIALFIVLTMIVLYIMIEHSVTFLLLFTFGCCIGMIVSIKLDIALRGLDILNYTFRYRENILKRLECDKIELDDLSYEEVVIQHYILNTYKVLTIEEQLLIAGQVIYMCNYDKEYKEDFAQGLYHKEEWAVERFNTYYADSMRGIRESSWFIFISDLIKLCINYIKLNK